MERWSDGANTHISRERKFLPLSSAHMLWSSYRTTVKAAYYDAYLSNKRRTFNQKSESRSHQLVIFSLTYEVERRHVRIPGIFKPNYNVFQPVCRWYGSCWQSTCSAVWENINRSAYVIGKSWFFPTSHEFAIKLRIKVNTEKRCSFSRWMRKKSFLVSNIILHDSVTEVVEK